MKPYVIIHNAVSLDGRVDSFPVDLGLYYGLASRWEEDATLVGSGTILKAPPESSTEDEPPSDSSETAAEETRPLLVVPDSRGRITNWPFLLRQPYWRRAVALVSASTPPSYLEGLERMGIGRIVAGQDHADLRLALEELNVQFGVKTVRVDSGGTLNGVLLRAGLVDEISLLVHPCLVGGMSPAFFFRAADLEGGAGLISLSLTHMEKLDGGVVWLRYKVS